MHVEKYTNIIIFRENEEFNKFSKSRRFDVIFPNFVIFQDQKPNDVSKSTNFGLKV